MGGFKLYVEDRAGLASRSCTSRSRNPVAGSQVPSLAGLFSSFQVSVPQIDVHVDRERVKTYGIPLTDVFETLQVYLGSLYANDFNRFGRTYQVNVQAESSFRMQPEQIAQLKTRNGRGEMVPLGSVLQVSRTLRPGPGHALQRLSGRRDQRWPVAGHSSGQAQDAIAELLTRTLPNGMTFEWTELAYQDAISGNTMFLIFPLCVLLVYGVLAAQYESWSLPLTRDPDRADDAAVGDRRRLADRRRQQRLHADQLPRAGGPGLQELHPDRRVRAAARASRARRVETAIVEACRIRLRPVLMTSVAFIMGVVPLVLASGPGAEVRRAMGVAVFAGMLGVTLFGLFLTPVFYTVVQGLAERFSRRRPRSAPHVAAAAEGH